jgi:two-component system, chemotaxis family, sensor kinase CheA
MTIEDDELIKDFIVESQEHLSDVESQLLTLESQQNGVDVALVNKVFRAVHSIKGAAGFLGFEVLETLAHRGEEVLNRLRNNEMRPSSLVINTLLKATDRLKQLLDSLDTSNEQNVTEHIIALEALLNGPNASSDEIVMESTNHECDANEPEQSEAPAVTIESNVSVESNDHGSGHATHPVDNSSGFNRETLREFLVENFDNLEQIDRNLIALERDPTNESLLNSIFRGIHSLKGSAGFLAFKHVETLAHAGENLLSSLRSNRLALNAETSRVLFSMIDKLRTILVAIERDGSEGSCNSEDMIKALNEVHQSHLVTQNPIFHTTMACEPKRDVQVVAETKKVSASNKQSSSKLLETSSSSFQDVAITSAADSTIRVDVALLDTLMTRVGELVLARNQILQFTGELGNSDLMRTTQRLNLITTELQEGVMKTRMQPIGNVWSKFPRLVRDLAVICGKEVRIEMRGKETELDKTIIEAIKDPLTHLVRNTVDHGIEKPEVRVSKGKPIEGCLTLRAFHEGGQVIIEICDDGAGLNLDRIKSKAIEKGLITQEQVARMQEQEISQLIFLPGFSTAEKVSNVSGRGVGMDVVKTNIEKIGGSVDLQTRPGSGTTIKIKIPLTLAIIPALIVTSAGNRFAIPQVNLLELVRLEGDQTSKSIEWIQGAPVYRLRGRLLPLVYLRKVLNINDKKEAPPDAVNIVILRADDRQFGLVVDRINDTEEIVVKPLSKQLKGVPVYSGTTIMGDGKVALILDVLGLAYASEVITKLRDGALAESNSRAKESNGKQQTLLILGTGTSRRLALPISQVARLEKIPKKEVEFADHQEVVQYRGKILPLIRLASFLSLECEESVDDDLLNVVVYIENERSFGLVIDQIVDIVELNLQINHRSAREGLLGSAVIHERVTDMVDLPAIIRMIENATLNPIPALV